MLKSEAMVEPVLKELPQLQVTVIVSYFGCISAFIGALSGIIHKNNKGGRLTENHIQSNFCSLPGCDLKCG